MYTCKRSEFLEICQLTFDRFLTNTAGSNFSAKASENSLYFTNGGNAKRNRCRMKPEEIILADMEGNILDGERKISSLWRSHYKMYQEFDFVGAAIHAHPRMATAFACQKEPMPPLISSMKKYGSIHSVPEDIDLLSEECADITAEMFRENGDSFKKYGHAVFYPYHGIFIAAPTMAEAFDLLDRIEFNAYAIIGSKTLSIGK